MDPCCKLKRKGRQKLCWSRRLRLHYDNSLESSGYNWETRIQFFCRSIEARQAKNNIRMLINESGVRLEQIQELKAKVVTYYEKLPGKTGPQV